MNMLCVNGLESKEVEWEQAVKKELSDQLSWYSRANLSPAIEKTEILPLGGFC